MDAIELPMLGGVGGGGDVSNLKALIVKGFDRGGLLVGQKPEHRELITALPVSGSSAIAGCTTARSSSKDKSRLVKQKHGLDGRRSDKRNFKVPVKAKIDSFLKNGTTCSYSSSGGHNILGIYGLKSDIHAVTKHVDELSLNELLDGSYKCPSLSQDKGKKAANTNENILHSVQKFCSVLQLQRPVPSQKDVELDTGSKKTETSLLDSDSWLASTSEFDKGDNSMTEKASPDKIADTHDNPGVSASVNAPLLQPKDVLERLALQPAKDLGSLLLDTAKPAVSSRTTDIRAGKPMAHRDSLPPFSWSHSFTGSCKANMDVNKMTNRSTCQSRWLRIGNTACNQKDDVGCLSDLDFFASDQNLVSLKQLNLGLSEPGITPRPVGLPWTDQASSSSVTCYVESHIQDRNILNCSSVMTSHYPLKYGLPHKSASPQPNKCFEEERCKRRKNADSAGGSCYSLFSSVGGHNNLQSHLHLPPNSKLDGHSPRLLAAAQILHEISRLSSMQNQSSEKIRWPKKLSQKAMKARKSRSPLRKTEVMAVAPKPATDPSVDLMDPDRKAVQPSKKPRFFVPNNQRKDITQTSNVGRGPMKFSTPTTSNRASPPNSRLEKGLVSDTKRLNPDTQKLLGTMPPSSTRVLDKVCNSQQKLRKPLFIDWSRGRSKKE